MDYESVFRVFTRPLGDRFYYRIDELWDMVNHYMNRDEFENAIYKLEKASIITLKEFALSNMTDEEINKCIKDKNGDLKTSFTWSESYEECYYTRIISGLEKENKSLKKRLEKLNDRIKNLTKPVGKRKTKNKKKSIPPILGWNIQLSNDHYYRAYKRINGKLLGCYLGKNDPSDNILRTEVKLRKKEREFLREEGL